MSETSHQTGWSHDKLLLFFLLLLVCLPLPLGSNRLPFWSVAEVWLALVLLIWVIQFLRGRRSPTTAFIRAWPFLLLLGLWCGYTAMQIVPLPSGMVDALSPESAWLHGITYDPQGGDRWITLSVDPYSTTLGLHKSIAFSLLAAVVLLLVDSHARLRRLAYALVVAGLIQVAIGLFSIDESLLHTQVKASFANRNHLANYLALCVAVGLGLLLSMTRNTRAANAAESLRRGLDWLFSARMRLRIALVLMAAVIVLTRSRMGNVAFFGSLLVAGGLMLLLVRERRRGMVVLLASLLVIDIAIVGSLVGVDRVVERLEDTSLAAETRDEVARDTVTYWRDFPWTGSGLGTFSVTYPRYKQGDVSLFYRRAHNDFLQFGAETGLVGVLLIGGALTLSVITAVITLRRRRDPLALGIAFSVLMATTAMLVHITVEFNLQVFANTATFMVILALAWVGAHLPGRQQTTTLPVVGRTPLVVALASLTLPALVFYATQVITLASADLIGQSNARALDRWERTGGVTAEQVRSAMRRQVRVIRLAPDNANAKLLLSRLSWWQLRTDEPPEARQVYDQMLYALLDASRSSPGAANAWSSILTVRHFQRRYDGLFQGALARTQTLAPWEPHVQQAVARVGLAAWDDLSNALARSIVIETIQRGLRADPVRMATLVERSGRLATLCPSLPPVHAARLCSPPR